jgi:hypothetical protein
MDPASANAARALIRYIRRHHAGALQSIPAPLLRQLLAELLDLGVRISDELDRREGL